MRKVRNWIKVVILSMMVFIIILIQKQTNAVVDSKRTDLETILRKHTSVDLEDIDIGDIIEAYDELSKQYTNQELADIIEQNSKEIEKQGLSKQTISAGTTILRSVDSEQLKKILQEDLNLDEIKRKMKNGSTPEELLSDLNKSLTTSEKINILGKMLWSSSIFIVSAIVLGILFIYGTILRWILYHKAGRNGFAAIIPIYRQVTMFKMCQMSPWWLLLLLVPVIGWFILLIVEIILKFKLAKVFGRGIGFGFGLLLLSIIFESVLAFNPNIRYVEE